MTSFDCDKIAENTSMLGFEDELKVQIDRRRNLCFFKVKNILKDIYIIKNILH